MAISNVPVISGPTFGGVIYGLNLKIGYSDNASELVLNIVNEKGEYQTPILNKPETVSCGNFTFNGSIQSYEIKETPESRLLTVTLIDNSIILDRYIVKLWNRGLFGIAGKQVSETKTFKFPDEPIVFYSRKLKKFVQTSLSPQSVSRNVFEAYGVIKNIIYLGREEFPNTKCDIPKTNYTLKDLTNILNQYGIVKGVNFRASDQLKKDTEGPLREVLKSWADACGIGWYWDFKFDMIRTFSLDKGVKLNLPLVKSSKLIEKNESVSLEGTFINYAIAYKNKPRETLEPINNSNAETFVDWAYAVPISNFLNKDDTLQALNQYDHVSIYNESASSGEYGKLDEIEDKAFADPKEAELALWGGRTEKQFLTAALLGYINEDLRNLYLYRLIWDVFNNSYGSSGQTVGYKIFNIAGIVLKSVYPILNDGFDGPGRDRGPASASGIDYQYRLKPEEIKLIYSFLNDVPDVQKVKNIESSYGGEKNLGELFDWWVGIKDDGVATNWNEVEQRILGYYGKYYYFPGTQNFKSFICTQDYTITVTTTIDPEPRFPEPGTKDFKNRKWWVRDGATMSHTKDKASELLGLTEEENSEALKELKIKEIDIDESGLRNLQILSRTKGKTIFIVPKSEILLKKFKTYNYEIGFSKNPLEKRWNDNDNSSEPIESCNVYDDRLKNSQCIDIKSEAKEKGISLAYTKLGEKPPSEDKNNGDPRTGLNTTISRSLKINLFKKTLKLCTPSSGPYRCVVNVERSIQLIPNINTDQKIFFKCDNLNLLNNFNKVNSIKIFNDNVTETDDFWNNLAGKPLQLATSVVNTEPTKKVSYKFAGFPEELNLDISEGLSSLNISYSDDGFTTDVEFSSRPPKQEENENDNIIRTVESRLNRSSFNAL